MQPIAVKAKAETDATSLRATNAAVAKGSQDIMDVPQAVTIVTERLMNDRQVDTLNQALKLMGGISFLAAEGGEQDIRLRGFSMSGDIYVDTLHDPAFYDRDMFGFERVELLRGSASMLFGRGSTGGVVNQVSKQAFLDDASQVNFTVGNDGFLRFVGDFNIQTGETSALRINLMRNTADNNGNFIDKEGVALNYRWGIGTPRRVRGRVLLPEQRQRHQLRPAVAAPQLDAGQRQPVGDDPGAGPVQRLLRRTRATTTPAAPPTAHWAGRTVSTTAANCSRRCATAATSATSAPAPSASASAPPMRTPAWSPIPIARRRRRAWTRSATPRSLTRGTQNKVQDMDTTYLQFNYLNTFGWFGVNNEVLAGLDLAHEEFAGYNTGTLPPGVTLNKNSPRTTIGTPDNGYGWVDESLRIKRQQAAFDARAAGIFAQDLIQVADNWKVLLGLRYDYFKGDYQSFQTASNGNVPVGTVTADRKRSDGEWSERFGVLYQPLPTMTYYFSYGTSFNTSGDTYAYDLPGSNTPPESSRNIELGAKLDLFNDLLSTRFSIFNITKYHERNRDSPAGTPLKDYLLSGERHATGLDIDIAGRITPLWDVFVSYAWIPIAEIDVGNADGTTLSGERVGAAPVADAAQQRLDLDHLPGAAAAAPGRGHQRAQLADAEPQPAGHRRAQLRHRRPDGRIQLQRPVGFMLNVTNVTNSYYADSLYTGHYMPGAPRTVQVTLTVRF